jgi:hypothetical protein
MPLLFSKLKEISVFIYTLILLLIFNLYFNLNFNWPGISSIVRIYTIIFSFYLIYIFASLDLSSLKEDYISKFGRKGKILLFIEIRVMPFLIIYLITILFTLIAEIKNLERPLIQLLSLLNGRHSNNIIYSWLLLIILRIKKSPGITIPLWISIFIIYGVLDWWLFSTINSGIIISFIKIIKIIIFLLLLLSEFFDDKKKCVISSLITGIIFFIISVGSFFSIFKFSDRISVHSKEAGLILLKMGITYPLDQLKQTALDATDTKLLNDLLLLSDESGNKQITYTNKQWEHLLFSGSANTADNISRYLLNQKINLSYERIMAYAESKSKEESGNLYQLNNFVKLAARCSAGHEKDLLYRLKKYDKNRRLLAIRILSENKTIESIPVLLIYLTDIDDKLANRAYDALKNIADMDPAAVLEKRRNDPDIIALLKEYYFKYSKNRTAY